MGTDQMQPAYDRHLPASNTNTGNPYSRRVSASGPCGTLLTSADSTSGPCVTTAQPQGPLRETLREFPRPCGSFQLPLIPSRDPALQPLNRRVLCERPCGSFKTRGHTRTAFTVYVLRHVLVRCRVFARHDNRYIRAQPLGLGASSEVLSGQVS